MSNLVKDFVPSKHKNKITIYYLVDLETGEKIMKREQVIELNMEKHKRNKKAGYKKYGVKLGWRIYKDMS